MAYFSTGAIVGERALLHDRIRTATVEIVTSATLAWFDEDSWYWLIGRNSRFEDFFWNLETNRLKQSSVEGSLTIPTPISEMNHSGDTQRGLETVTTILATKIATNDFDVFLAHNSLDKEQVRVIAALLKEHGLYPWIDEEQIPPRRPFQKFIQQAIAQVKTAAVFIGPKDLGRQASASIEIEGYILRTNAISKSISSCHNLEIY